MHAFAKTVIGDGQGISDAQTWTTQGNPYIVSHLYIGKTGSLYIEPGVVMKFGLNSSIIEDGTLTVGSTSSSEAVVFTSLADNSYGGDTHDELDPAYASSSPEEVRWNNIIFDGNAVANIQNARFRYGGGPNVPNGCETGQTCWDDAADNATISVQNATVSITDSVFEQTPGNHFLLGDGSLHLERDQFASAIHFMTIWNAPDDTAASSFTMHDSSLNGIQNTLVHFVHGNVTAHAEVNWWGDASGPSDAKQNPNGDIPLGIDNFPFVPWLTNDPFATITVQVPAAAATTMMASNVLFIPGMMESRLYMRDSSGREKRIWEPNDNNDVSLLAMGPEGASVHELYTRDIIDHLYADTPAVAALVRIAAGNNSVLYGPFEDFMNGLVTRGTISTWRAYPYDWRYGVDDVIQRGTLVGTTDGTFTRVYLQDLVQQLASSSPTGRVTIIAHSNGGLLAKALAIDLQNKGKINLLDHIIVVGTPQLGTPIAIGQLLHGDGQTRVLGLVTFGGTVRANALSMAGPYDLLPSSTYFNHIGTAFISFAQVPALEPYIAALGTSIKSFESLTDFLIDAAGQRTQPSTNDLKTPAIASYELIQKAKAVHDAIDNWTPPASVSLTSIVGWGQNTISGYTYSSPGKNLSCGPFDLFSQNCTTPLIFSRTIQTTEDGDTMVVAPSAAGTAGQTLYFNAKQYMHDTGITITHQSLLSAQPIQDEIRTLLFGATSTEPYIGVSEPSGARSPLIVLHITANAHLIVSDSKDSQTGTVTIPSVPGVAFDTENIAGSSVQSVDDDKYVYVPDDGAAYSVTVQGETVGTTSLDIGTIGSDGTATTAHLFPTIPITASTTATLTITSTNGVGSSNVAPIVTAPKVDEDGDGSIDFVATSTPNASQTTTSTSANKTTDTSESKTSEVSDSSDQVSLSTTTIDSPTSSEMSSTSSVAATAPSSTTQSDDEYEDTVSESPPASSASAASGSSSRGTSGSESGAAAQQSLPVVPMVPLASKSFGATATTSLEEQLFILELELKLLLLKYELFLKFHIRSIF